MKHLRAVNKKARRIEHMDPAIRPQSERHSDDDVVALQNQPNQAPPPRPHVPMGCALAFSPGWEVDSSGGTAGLCQPVERDIYDCYVTCFWPAQVPDHLNNYPDWAGKCAAATKDWRNLDLVFP
ncbi:MAG: quinohemoprotein amine dehydrogenase subunit gamma [Bryobacterales bacterium]|nr:quinohemoprotein amine dehydrogenase subunit gamma [Bryobacterales bacterium]MBV9400629.1 quinohemoprotein amine dehydrogenase subunit gamma [Bryobacterales bacterium]